MNSSRKKIVILATAIGHSNRGIGQYERAILPPLVSYLTLRGHLVRVILSKDGPKYSADYTEQFARLPIRRDNTLLRILAEQIYVPWLCRGADIFVSLESVFPLVPLRVKSKVVVIHDVHVLQNKMNPHEYPEEYSRQYKIWANIATRRAIEDSTKIITVSRFTGNEITRMCNIHSNKIIAIHNGLDHSRFFPPPNSESNDKIRKLYKLPQKFYLFIGPYSIKKNLRLVIEAIARSQPGSPWIFPVVVAGDTRRNKLYGSTEALLREYGIEGCFHFLGTVSDEHLPSLYSAAYAFIYPSLYEGFGLPPIEAMACGTPVIASNRTSLPEVLGDAALYVDPTNPNSMIEAMRQLNESLVREDLVKKGLAKAKQYSWEKTAGQISKVICDEVVD